jgi:hypothetical protein
MESLHPGGTIFALCLLLYGAPLSRLGEGPGVRSGRRAASYPPWRKPSIFHIIPYLETTRNPIRN